MVTLVTGGRSNKSTVLTRFTDSGKPKNVLEGVTFRVLSLQ